MIDPRLIGDLHVITDSVRQQHFEVVELARLAACGGARIVQIRDKAPCTTRELVAAAGAIRLHQMRLAEVGPSPSAKITRPLRTALPALPPISGALLRAGPVIPAPVELGRRFRCTVS